MSLEPTADQRDLRAAVATFLADRSAESVVRGAEPLGFLCQFERLLVVTTPVPTPLRRIAEIEEHPQLRR